MDEEWHEIDGWMKNGMRWMDGWIDAWRMA
jgi:hypothetical protein